MAPLINPASFGPRQAQPLEGFMSNAKSLVEDLFGKSDPKDLPLAARVAVEHSARVRGIAARLFAPGSDGEELLEHLADAMLRRPFLITQLQRDQALMYAAKREGQADAIYYLLALIAEGRSEQPPQRGESHATSKSQRRKRVHAPSAVRTKRPARRRRS